MPEAARLVTTTEEVRSLARELLDTPRVAVDLESDGIFAYRARVCTVQLAWGDGPPNVALVDALVADLAPLGPVLAASGPVKIIHDVAFDTRMLTEASLPLGNVHDTSIAARMLGRVATGLSTLLEAELGVVVSKALQHHDWRVRPLTDAHLTYLASDVFHLAALHDVLWAELEARGIEAEVDEETRYRVESAAEGARTPDPREPYERVKGIERASGVELAVARRLAVVRDEAAQARDVPPHRVMSAEALLAVARARPAKLAELRRMRIEGGAFAEAVLAAVREGIDDGAVPARAPKTRVSAESNKERRAREGRLTAWRKAEAKVRGIDEQVVLPGHCLKDIAGLEGAPSLDALSEVAGLGAFRVARDGEAILRALAARPRADGTP